MKIRAFAGLAASAVWLVGCVTVNGPGGSVFPTSPASSPPGTLSAPPSVAGTTPVAATPLIPPVPTIVTGTAPPVVTTPPVPTPGATPVGSMLGTDILLFTDEFDDPSSGWAVGESEQVHVGYEEGVLALGAVGAASYLTTGRAFGMAFDRARFAAIFEVQPSSDGIYGVHCRDADGDTFGGAVTTDGSYVLYRGVGGAQEEIVQREDSAPLAGTGPGSTVGLMIECATGAAGLEVYFSANGQLLLHYTQTQTDLGPVTSVGVFLQTEGEMLLVDMTEAAAWVGVSPAAVSIPTAATGAVNIEDHIPTAIRPMCSEILPWDERASEAWQCDLADGTFIYYLSFVDAATATDFFEGNLSGDEVVDSECSDGNDGVGDYTIAGEPIGRYQCYVLMGTARIQWTTPDLNMVSQLSNPDGDFEAVWDAWQDAGPNL